MRNLSADQKHYCEGVQKLVARGTKCVENKGECVGGNYASVEAKIMFSCFIAVHYGHNLPHPCWQQATIFTTKTLTSFRRVRKIAISDYQLRHICPSFRLSTWSNSVPNGRIFIKSLFEYFSKICRENSRFIRM